MAPNCLVCQARRARNKGKERTVIIIGSKYEDYCRENNYNLEGDSHLCNKCRIRITKELDRDELERDDAENEDENHLMKLDFFTRSSGAHRFCALCHKDVIPGENTNVCVDFRSNIIASIVIDIYINYDRRNKSNRNS